MGNGSKRKKKSKNRKKKIFIVKVVTVTVAIGVTVLLGVLIPKSLSDKDSSIEMTKDYEPGEDVSNSIKKNQEIEGLIDDDMPESTITITNEDNDIVKAEEVTTNTEVEVEPIEEVIDKEPIETVEDNNEMSEEVAVVEDKTTEQISTDVETVSTENNTETTIESNTETETETTEETLVNVEEETPIEPEETPLETEDETQYVKDEWVDDMIHDNQDSIDANDLATGAAIYNKLDTGYLFGLADGGMTDEEKAEAMIYLESNLTPEEFVIARSLFNKYIGLAN